MYKLIIAGTGVIAIALLAIGCGSGGESEATAQVSEAQFMEQAKTICAKTHKEVAAAFVGQGASGTEDRIEQISLLLKQEAEDLDAMTSSKQVEAKFDPLIESVSQASGVLAQKGKDGLNDPRIAAYKQVAKTLHLANC